MYLQNFHFLPFVTYCKITYSGTAPWTCLCFCLLHTLDMQTPWRYTMRAVPLFICPSLTTFKGKAMADDHEKVILVTFPLFYIVLMKTHLLSRSVHDSYSFPLTILADFSQTSAAPFIFLMTLGLYFYPRVYIRERWYLEFYFHCLSDDSFHSDSIVVCIPECISPMSLRNNQPLLLLPVLELKLRAQSLS